MSPPRRSPRRILVGAVSFADARPALELMNQLAARTRFVVGGLLVEEPIFGDLPRLARQRVVSPGGTLLATPTVEQARRMMESDARDFARALAALSHDGEPLQRRQGELALAMWEAAAGWDALVLGHRMLHGLRGRVVLIAPPTGAGSAAPAQAEALASALHTSVAVLALGDEPADLPAEHFTSQEALLHRVARMHCAAIVLDRTAGPITTVDQLRALTAAARCPVVVLGEAPATSAKHGI